MYFCAVVIVSNRNYVVGYENCDYGLTYEGILMLRVILPLKTIHPVESSNVLWIAPWSTVEKSWVRRGTVLVFWIRISLLLKMGPMDCPEASERNYHYNVRNIPKERWSQGINGLWTKAERNCAVRIKRKSLWWSVRMCYSNNTTSQSPVQHNFWFLEI